jgi:hypothetical protein
MRDIFYQFIMSFTTSFISVEETMHWFARIGSEDSIHLSGKLKNTEIANNFFICFFIITFFGYLFGILSNFNK